MKTTNRLFSVILKKLSKTTPLNQFFRQLYKAVNVGNKGLRRKEKHKFSEKVPSGEDCQLNLEHFCVLL